MVKNINGRLKKIEDNIKSDDRDTIFIEVNNDKSMDIELNNQMQHFNNYNDYINIIKKDYNNPIFIILDDLRLCN
jgi:hypothetical protein